MSLKVSFFFAWYDFWVGAYYDRDEQVLYVCPLPMCVFKIESEDKYPWARFHLPYGER